MNELTIYDYAKQMTNDKILTFYDAAKILLKNINCIVCLESAADLLGYSDLGYIKQIHIYTIEVVDKPYLKCHLVDSLDKIQCLDYKGLLVTPIELAIVEMLQNDSTDSGVLYETFAKYYCYNNDSYKKLSIPNRLRKKANHFMEEGKLFYEY